MINKEFQGMVNKNLTIQIVSMDLKQVYVDVCITDGVIVCNCQICVHFLLPFGINKNYTVVGKFSIKTNIHGEYVPVLSSSKEVKNVFKIKPIPGHHYLWNSIEYIHLGKFDGYNISKSVLDGFYHTCFIPDKELNKVTENYSDFIEDALDYLFTRKIYIVPDQRYFFYHNLEKGIIDGLKGRKYGFFCNERYGYKKSKNI